MTKDDIQLLCRSELAFINLLTFLEIFRGTRVTEINKFKTDSSFMARIKLENRKRGKQTFLTYGFYRDRECDEFHRFISKLQDTFPRVNVVTLEENPNGH